MTSPRRMRRGVALITTLAAISLLGILAVMSVRVARARLVGARRVLGVHAAMLVATRALDSTLAASRGSEWAQLPIGTARSLRREVGEQLVLHRLQSRLFRLDVAIGRGDPIAPTRHAASLLVRADAPHLDRGAPIVASATVVIARDFLVDALPADHACAGVVPPIHVLAADSTAVRWEDPASAGATRELASLREPTAFDREIARVQRSAQLVLDDGAIYGPTADSTRIVLARGDLTLGPGAGEGVMLVMGRLSIVGPLRFRGSILALGGISSTGTGIDLAGTVTSVGAVQLSGGVLRYDPCASERASISAARLHPLGRWSGATLW